MKCSTSKGEGHWISTLKNIINRALEKEHFDIIVTSMKVPAGNSYAYVMSGDQELLKEGHTLPPIMPVNGARALSSILRRGKSNRKIGVVLRPCEARGAIELVKIGQINADNLTIISVDCPGVMPINDYVSNPMEGEKKFTRILEEWGGEGTREICNSCAGANDMVGDVHAGSRGLEDGEILFVGITGKGELFMKALELEEGANTRKGVEKWMEKCEEERITKEGKREELKKEFGKNVFGLDNLLSTFSRCINCHNCSRVCPICYCQHCYFDSEQTKTTAAGYMEKAVANGALRMPPGMLAFHVGRMLHMSLSCTSCGMCSDACPVDIPVSQIFSLVGQDARTLFEYVPGENPDDPTPLTTYRVDEFQEIGE